MLKLLFLTNFDFVVWILASFTFLSGGWLYLDSWKVHRQNHTPLIRALGFLLVSVSFLFSAMQAEWPALPLLIYLIRLGGLTLIFTSLISEPVLTPPSKKHASHAAGIVLGATQITTGIFSSLIALASGLIAGLYLLKATRGYEKQLRLAGTAFLFLFLGDISRLPFLFSETKVVYWSRLLAEHGPLWLGSTTLTLAGVSILFVWIWGYLRFRVQPQLFITVMGLTVVVFLTIVTSFSYLTLKNLESDLLANLQVNSRLFQYSIERRELEVLAAAQAIAANPTAQTREAALASVSASQKLDHASLISTEGEIVVSLNGADNGRSLVDDPLWQSASNGRPLATLVSFLGGLTPHIQVEAAAPVKTDGTVGEVVKTGYLLDSAFIDGIKAFTGLEVTLFAGETRSASTLFLADGKTRYLGVKETNRAILDRVLATGQSFVGPNRYLDGNYYSAYEPLRGLGGQVVGMLAIAENEAVMFDNLRSASQSTFLLAAILVAFSSLPAYLLAKYIGRNLTA